MAGLLMVPVRTILPFTRDGSVQRMVWRKRETENQRQKREFIRSYFLVPAKVLLGFSPLLTEDSYTSENHKDLIEFVLDVFGNTLSNVICLIGDNCNVNKSLADLCGIPLVGCACHRLNLAIQEYLGVASREKLIAEVLLCFNFLL
jgi:hypothetical protein